ncbi:MAG: PD-(D/E)XK nuclease family protein [Dehalococcoidia bacterium]|nr:PD-(D/E)XK nuclease family protein [Dehalococcoidia bacterium]
MPIYSHSQLSTYENCPLKYKLCYRDKIKRGTEGVEAFLGSRVHEVLQRCYDDTRRGKLDSLDELLAYYDALWEKNWHDGITITRAGFTADHYRDSGHKMLSSYYARHAPFKRDVTLATEMLIPFSLDGGRHRLRGYIDRLSRTPDGTYYINDYKTSAHLPSQEEADADRQLALYQIGIQQRWSRVGTVQLIWHYLSFDCELVSHRSAGMLAELEQATARLIDEIEAAQDFPPQESALCNWCEYPDLCPSRKHLYAVEALPTNKFLNEPGVVIVNRYAELREKAKEIEEETALLKEALLNYCQENQLSIVRGSNHRVRVKREDKLRFPGKNEPGRAELEQKLLQAGKLAEVSQLDTTALVRAVTEEHWDKAFSDDVRSYGTIEETCTVYCSKLKEEE